MAMHGVRVWLDGVKRKKQPDSPVFSERPNYTREEHLCVRTCTSIYPKLPNSVGRCLIRPIGLPKVPSTQYWSVGVNIPHVSLMLEVSTQALL